jgi:hypothetical protein
MGERGPAPKRSTQRRRTNKESKPETITVPGEVDQPKPKQGWHPIAKRWYESLADSGQSAFYEPSDWAMAYLIAENLSRELKPRFVGTVTKRDEHGEYVEEAITATLPMNGSALSGTLKAMTSLLVTEADRRRAQIEIERGGGKDDEDGDVPNLADYRDRLTG